MSRPHSDGLARSFDAHAVLAGPRQRIRSTPDRFWSRLNKEGPIVRRAHAAGESVKSIVGRTGLATGTIHPMLHGKTWAHVPMPLGRERRPSVQPPESFQPPASAAIEAGR